MSERPETEQAPEAAPSDGSDPSEAQSAAAPDADVSDADVVEDPPEVSAATGGEAPEADGQPLLVARSLFDVAGSPPFETKTVDIAGGARSTSVEVNAADAEALGEFLSQHLRTIASSSKVAEEDRAWACLHVLRRVLRRTFAETTIQSADLQAATREIAALLATSRPEALLPGHGTVIEDDLVERAVDTAFHAGLLAAADGLRDRKQLAAIVLAGAVADIGKLELPEELLQSRGPLHDRDWQLVRWHPHLSIEKLRLAGIADAAVLRGVLAHHERWSGDGYPQGLVGEAIPFEARYVAVADSFSALSVARPFRERRSSFEALGEMAKPGQFEPRPVRAFILLLRSEEDAAENEPDAARGPIAA